MFDKYYRPLPDVISIKCDYKHLPYRFRQKIRSIQHQILELRQLSKNQTYRMYLYDDACCMVDLLKNKIIWSYKYSSSMGHLVRLLDDLYRLYVYEKDNYYPKNIIQVNDYLSLKKKFYGCKERVSY